MMRTSIRYLRLGIAIMIAAIGLSVLGIGAALAAPGRPAKPTRVSVVHEQTSKDKGRDLRASRDRASRDRASRDRASRAERSEAVHG
jgi:hypothetical protein